jgi:serine protease
MRERRHKNALLQFSFYFVLLVSFVSCAEKNYCGRPEYEKGKYYVYGLNSPDPGTIYVYPPTEISSPDVPYNDPYFTMQWQLQKDFLNIVEAHKYTMGDSHVVVGMLDTGLDINLPDFQGVNFLPGFNYVDNNTDTSDGSRHGTGTASVICMQPNNKIGGVGIAPRVSIMPMKVIPLNHKAKYSKSEGDESPINVAKAIVSFTDFCKKEHYLGVMNLSFGVYNGYKKAELVEAAILYARQNGILAICAAGNDGYTMNQVGWPAFFPEAVSVGAFTRGNVLAQYSNYQLGLDLVAPGGSDSLNYSNGYINGIFVTTDTNERFVLSNIGYLRRKFFRVPSDSPPYFMWMGTSEAAPHVTGTVALILSLGITDPDTIMDIIYASANRSSDYNPCYYGRGVLNTGAAVKLAYQIKSGEITLEQLKVMPKGTILEDTLSPDKKQKAEARHRSLLLNVSEAELKSIIESIRQMPVDQ